MIPSAPQLSPGLPARLAAPRFRQTLILVELTLLLRKMESPGTIRFYALFVDAIDNHSYVRGA